jgi:hypothetical protein
VPAFVEGCEKQTRIRHPVTRLIPGNALANPANMKLSQITFAVKDRQTRHLCNAEVATERFAETERSST